MSTYNIGNVVMMCLSTCF